MSSTNKSNAHYLDQKYTQAVNQVEDLNNTYRGTFKNRCIDKGIKPIKRNNPQVIQEYFDYTGQLFHDTDDRIFMKNPRLSAPDFDDPFKIIDLNSEFETYITSTTAPVGTQPDIKGYYPEYWGDAVAIDILNSVLKLKIIVLKNGAGGGALRPDIFDNGLFENQTQKEIEDLGCNLNEWNKYLFVYNPGGHYVLLTFTYSTKEDSRASKSKIVDTNTYTIFKKDDYILPPPLYIFFLIFYIKFLLLPPDKKIEFNFFRDFFLIMDDSYQRILGTNSEAGYRVIENFNTWNPQVYFRESLRDYNWKPPEPSKMGRPVGSMTGAIGDPTRFSTRLNPSDTTMVRYPKGGASNTRTRKNYNNNYRNNYPNNFLKRDAVRDVSKIGYYISMDLELKKGSPLTPEEISESKCTRKWNTVRKAFANFTGKTYAIPPVYDYSNKQTLKNKPNNKPNNVTKSNKPPLQIQTQAQATPQTNVANPTNKTGGTRKNEVKKIYLTGKHNKTVKKL